jgi:hypothetical protein
MINRLLKPFIAADSSSAMLWVMLAFIAVIAVLGPLLVIQALNVLFNLSIPYNLQTWCAVVILNAFISVAVKK